MVGAGSLALTGTPVRAEPNNGHCVGTGMTGHDTSGPGGLGVSIFCCSGGQTAELDQDGTAWCFDGSALPGPSPGPINGGNGGGNGGGGGHGGCTGEQCNQPPECTGDQPAPTPPSGQTVGPANKVVKAGEKFDLTPEFLKDNALIALDDEQQDYYVIKLDEYLQKVATTPKAPCRETCRSCNKQHATDTDALDASLAACQKQYEGKAKTKCKLGMWRHDPRHHCGILEANGVGGDPDHCGEPGQEVPANECYNTTLPNGHPGLSCHESDWMHECKASWMNDLPATSTTDTDPSWTVTIGPVSRTSAGHTETITLDGGQGYNTACAKWNDEDQKKVDKKRDDCFKRVMDAHPGVTCDVQ
jgi:hypothetical protein